MDEQIERLIDRQTGEHSDAQTREPDALDGQKEKCMDKKIDKKIDGLIDIHTNGQKNKKKKENNLFIFMSICLYVYQTIYLSIHPFLFLPI